MPTYAAYYTKDLRVTMLRAVDSYAGQKRDSGARVFYFVLFVNVYVGNFCRSVFFPAQGHSRLL